MAAPISVQMCRGSGCNRELAALRGAKGLCNELCRLCYGRGLNEPLVPLRGLARTPLTIPLATHRGGLASRCTSCTERRPRASMPALLVRGW
jgi:hypothetical protein